MTTTRHTTAPWTHDGQTTPWLVESHVLIMGMPKTGKAVGAAVASTPTPKGDDR